METRIKNKRKKEGKEKAEERKRIENRNGLLLCYQVLTNSDRDQSDVSVCDAVFWLAR